MLGLKASTDPAFVLRFQADVEAMLLDHAHCEKKAAATALNMLGRYPDHPGIVDAMADIVDEEMAHFRQVIAIMASRGWSYRGCRPSLYAGRLHALCRRGYREALVDRLLISALIEARSCERFALLGAQLDDDELRTFYGSLFASEARHYATYVKLALAEDDEASVRARLDELLTAEAEIVRLGEDAPKLHA
jgi:tRNA-(ms[2]io[6]A)-hydroxylase